MIAPQGEGTLTVRDGKRALLKALMKTAMQSSPIMSSLSSPRRGLPERLARTADARINRSRSGNGRATQAIEGVGGGQEAA
jgi:hypothetical protein